MSEGFEIVGEREGLGCNPGLRVVHLREFEEPYGLTGDERLAYRRRFTTLLVDEGSVRRGGLGCVRRATNALGEVFALKTLLEPEPVEGEEQDAFAMRSKRAWAAFRKEYEAQRSLSGFKGFPRLYGFARVDDVPAIVMEWVDGVTLAQARRELAVDDRGRMAPLDAARLGRDLFELLTRLDLVGEGFVHRDISPSNVMLRTSRLSATRQAEEGGFDLCLIDFGSSVPLDPAQDPLFTSRYASVRRATVAYAAPEMLSDDLPRVALLRKSAAVDVYAAASVLFELLSGELPFDVAEDGEASPFRVKTDERPAALVSAHNPAASMAELLPYEPEAAHAVARAMRELGTDLDPAEACAALSRVDEQLADLVAACLNPDQGKRPTAHAMCESLAAFCANYAENVRRAVRGERLLPCTAGALWNESLSPYAINRVINVVGRAVALALLVGVTAVTAILLDGLRASWSLGPLYWSGALTAPVLAVTLLAPAAVGFGVRTLARRSGRCGVLPASIALGVSAVALCAVASGLSVRGMSGVNGLSYALIATASAGWVPIVLDYAMMVIPALLMELRRMPAALSAGVAPGALELDEGQGWAGARFEPRESGDEGTGDVPPTQSLDEARRPEEADGPSAVPSCEGACAASPAALAATHDDDAVYDEGADDAVDTF